MVADHSVAPCRTCKFCKMGLSDYCENKIIIGFTIPGAFAEYVVVPEELLISIPSNISPNEAACIQPLSECVTEVYNSGINPADSIAIIGQGVMGLFTLATLRYTGAGKVIVIDVRDEVLKVSKVLGANHIINAQNADPKKTVLELTQGIGVDVVFECSGQGFNIRKALEFVKRNGKIVCLSIIGGETSIPLTDFRHKCVNLIFPGLTTFRMLEHTGFLLSNGWINLKPLITHRLKGIDKVPESFEITGNKAKYKAISAAQVIIY
jgi:threonine dehydrogenase-like Zn-dependent dehydrogenase